VSATVHPARSAAIAPARRPNALALELLCGAAIFAAIALLPVLALGADELSTSVMRPSAVPANGVVAGAFPSGEARYYFAMDVQPGDLMTQMSYAGRDGAPKEVELELLDGSARVRDHYWIHGSEPSAQATRGFPIDATGRQVFRLRVKGPETGRFCLELGGKAFPTTGDGGCPAPPATAGAPATAPPTVKTTRAGSLEIVESRCEQRLRVGSDLFFDFDSSSLRHEAEPTLGQITERLTGSQFPVAIEGHTDAKGADDYNQHLSEERAGSVKTYLVAHGVPPTRLTIVGWGKRKPVAPNAKADGSDDPDGRQRNRRVEIVINTCV